MPRDRNIRRALARQRDPSLPPSLALDASSCPILAPDVPMRIRLERRDEPLPVCPEPEACPVRRFFAAAAAAGAPVEIDVGAGYGRFSRGRAAARPELRILAVEQEAARVARSDVAARLAGIGNLALLRAEARWALEYCVPPDSVSAAYVLFPDPWPKDRHAHNRFFRAPNVALVRRILRPGGVLQTATDNEPYFAQILETMAAAPGFEPAEPAVRTEGEKTDFERKFVSQGKRIFEAAWRKTAGVVVAAALAAAAAAPAPAAEWTGGGETRSWNDAGNWADGAVPVPAPGLSVSFDSPDGASFGFKGRFRVGSIHLATNSGPVSLRAAGTVLGGSVNSEPEVGWVVEDSAATVKIANESASPLVFEGGVSAAWDVAFDVAEGGSVAIAGGFDAAGRGVEKTGPGAFELRGGETDLSGMAFRGGPVTLSGGAGATVTTSSLGNRDAPDSAPWTVGPGSRLVLASGADRIFAYSPFSLGVLPPGSPAPAAGSPKTRLEGSEKTLVFCVPPAFGPNSKVEHPGSARFAFGGTNDAPATVLFPAGFSWTGGSIFLGGWPNDPANKTQKEGIGWMRLSVEGAQISLSGDFSVGGSCDNVMARNMSASLSDGASLDVRGAVRVPAAPGCSRGNSLRAGPGTTIACEGLFVGAASVSNLTVLSGARVSVGGRGVDVGLESNWDGSPRGNTLALGDGAVLRAKSLLMVGRGRRARDKQLPATDNRVFVQGGSRLETVGAVVGVGGCDDPTSGSRVDVSGKGSSWGLAGRDLTVGDAVSGPVTNCSVVVRDGASLVGVQRVAVGAAGAAKASGCSLVVDGGRVATSNAVCVGTTRDGKGKAPSAGNRIAVGGRRARGNNPARPGIWDFNKAPLKIGCGAGWNQEVSENRFDLLPGGRAENIGEISVGCGDGAIPRGNRLGLLGGSASPVKSLSLGRRSVVEIAVDPSLKLGTSPLGVEGDVDFGSDATILPIARPGAKPGTYPVLAWKGKTIGDPSKIKLHPSADQDKWKLVVDAEGKRIGVRLSK